MTGDGYWLGLLLSSGLLLAEEPMRAVPPPVQTAPLATPTPVQLLPAPQPLPKEEKLPIARPSGELPRQLERLNSEREALQQERHKAEHVRPETGGPVDAETVRLRLRLAELLLKLSTREAAKAPPPRGDSVTRPPAARSVTGPPGQPARPETTDPVDPYALADSLYKAADFEAALGTYRLLESSEPSPEDKVYLHYMIGCCLRRLGKLDDAVAVFREVANAGQADPALANAAQWQIGSIRWRQEQESQLAQLRKRREAVEAKR